MVAFLPSYIYKPDSDGTSPAMTQGQRSTPPPVGIPYLLPGRRDPQARRWASCLATGTQPAQQVERVRGRLAQCGIVEDAPVFPAGRCHLPHLPGGGGEGIRRIGRIV